MFESRSASVTSIFGDLGLGVGNRYVSLSVLDGMQGCSRADNMR